MSLLRTFIALDIPNPIRQAIQQKIDLLRALPGAACVRWVAANSIHLTLKFLGETSPADLEAITQGLRVAAAAVGGFDFQVGGFGAFPSSRRARVLFIGVQAPAELEVLQRGIESACAPLGYAPEPRAFSPHLTIGRIKPEGYAAEQEKIRHSLADFHIDSLGTARVDSVHLYRSDLQPHGAVYTKLFSARLGPVRAEAPQRTT